jgi:hypothetical protein
MQGRRPGKGPGEEAGAIARATARESPPEGDKKQVEADLRAVMPIRTLTQPTPRSAKHRRQQGHQWVNP